MTDLYLGLFFIGGLSATLFVASLLLSRFAPRWASGLLALLVILAMERYSRHVWFDVRLASLLPVSNLIVVGNWFLPLAALLGGFAWNGVPGQRFGKALALGGLALAAGYSTVAPLLGSSPACGDVWRGECCMQTTPRTCTAASAATLLRMHGITATESEMAKVCLTRAGTNWMGLYRGLKLKTRGTRWDVRVVKCSSRELIRDTGRPTILSVGIDGDLAPREATRFVEWGWRPGEGHSVVLLQPLPEDSFLIADPAPAYGLETWSSSDLDQLFQGTAIHLVERY